MPAPVTDLPLTSVAIVGVGLIGGSFGLALRGSGFTGPILGVSSKPAIEAALRNGAISAEASLPEAVERADLLYLAQPVARILQTIDSLGTRLAETLAARLARRPLLITDAGSTKHVIVEKARNFLPPSVFLGGHPMAGKEVSGVEAAEASLFQKRPYILTPGPQMANPFLASFHSQLLAIGAAPLILTPEEHDAVVAMTSHLPQLLSTALGLTLAANPSPHYGVVHGGGLTDMTRLALSSPELWQSIVETNRAQILAAIDLFSAQLTLMRQAVESGEIGTPFTIAKTICIHIRNANH